MKCSVAAIVFLLAAPAAAVVTSAKSGHPIENVIGMLKGLMTQVTKEGEEEEYLYQKFEYWCKGSKADLSEAISKGKASESSLRRAAEEHRIWQKVRNHHSCVQLLEAFTDGFFYFMVMEKCDATLVRLVKSRQQMSSPVAAQLFLQMLRPLAHLHGKGIVHRDVKPDNYLLTGTGRSTTLKLGDFGLSAEVPKKSAVLLSGCFGTVPYMSPEMAGSSGHRLNTDIWSLGAAAYLLLYADWPYSPTKRTPKAFKLAVILGYKMPSFASNRNPQPCDLCQAFVRSLLVRERHARCSAKEALKHPFLSTAVASPQEMGEFFWSVSSSAAEKVKLDDRDLTTGPSSFLDTHDETANQHHYLQNAGSETLPNLLMQRMLTLRAVKRKGCKGASHQQSLSCDAERTYACI